MPMLNHPNKPSVTLESPRTTRNASEPENKKLHFFGTEGGAGGEGGTKTKIG